MDRQNITDSIIGFDHNYKNNSNDNRDSRNDNNGGDDRNKKTSNNGNCEEYMS